MNSSFIFHKLNLFNHISNRNLKLSLIHKYVLTTMVAFLFFVLNGNAQGGVWTWMRGDSILASPTGNYGTLGVASNSNEPPARYHSTFWQDSSGKFWLFGGTLTATIWLNDLWMYDPSTNLWTWVNGPQLNTALAGSYGTQGVPSASNYPKHCHLTGISWTDNSNHLWLIDDNGAMWKYDIATNQWAWMSGSSTGPTPVVFGTLGVLNSNNQPGVNAENKAAWTNDDGTLWMYNLGNVWKYDPSVNMWARMKATAATNYGTMGVEAPTNHPDAAKSFNYWKDNCNNFYIGIYGFSGGPPTLWRYNPNTNMWTWVNGSTTVNSVGNRNFGTQCVESPQRHPGRRNESRGINYPSPDYKDIFWFSAGIGAGIGDMSDLWMYKPYTNAWTWVSGDSTSLGFGNFGVKGVASPTNQPNSFDGHAMWVDRNQTVWLFGGASTAIPGVFGFNNTWRFVPDSACMNRISIAFALHLPSDTILCPGETSTMLVDSSVTISIAPSTGYTFNSDSTEYYFNPSATTTYTVTGSNGYCATKSITFTIYVEDASFTPPSNQKICIPGGSAPLVISSPPINTQFGWNPGGQTGTAISVSPATTTVYTITATTTSGCTFDTTVTVQVDPISWLNTSVTNVNCTGGGLGSISTQATSSSPVQYTINPTGVTNSTGNFPNLTPGSYTVTASNSLNCTVTTSLTVNQSATLNLVSLTTKNPSCFGNSDGSATVVYSNSSTFNYTLLPDNITNTSGQFTNLGNGIYSIITTDPSGCADTVTFELTTPNELKITKLLARQILCSSNDLGVITTVTEGGTKPIQYVLKPGSFANSTGIFSNLSAGNYTVEVIDSSDCFDSDTVNITQQICCNNIIVPNAFSPNGDEINDVLTIVNPFQIKIEKFVIANRWGNIVFSTTDPLIGWDGRLKGEELASDTYYYFLEYTCLTTNKTTLIKGDIQLIR